MYMYYYVCVVACLQNVTVQENCAGRDGATYTLRCTAHINDLPKNQQVPPFDVPFFFYNGKCRRLWVCFDTKP